MRAVKNRFGAVSELGVFEMTGAGLKPVPNPSALFLAERKEGAPGSAVVATIEGSRPMLVEVQALVSPTSFGTPRRMSLGIDPNRTNLLLAVLEKRVGLELLGDDVFVSVAGGLDVDEPAADLGVAAAIASSFRDRPLPPHTVLFGEVGLGGEVRGAGQAPAPGARGRADGLHPLHPARPQRPRGAPTPGSASWGCRPSRRPSTPSSATPDPPRLPLPASGRGSIMGADPQGHIMSHAASFATRGRSHRPRKASPCGSSCSAPSWCWRSAGRAGTTIPSPASPLVGLALGVLFALAIIGLELRLRQVSAHDMVGALVGGVTGLVGACLVLGVIDRLDLVAENFVHSLLIVFLVYIGMVIGTHRRASGSSRRASSPPSRTPRACTSTRSSTPR